MLKNLKLKLTAEQRKDLKGWFKYQAQYAALLAVLLPPFAYLAVRWEGGEYLAKLWVMTKISYQVMVLSALITIMFNLIGAAIRRRRAKIPRCAICDSTEHE